MKLQSYLPQQGLRLYIAPMLNGILLLLIFFLLGSSFVTRSGISVNLPESGAPLTGYERAHIITMAPSDGGLYFDGQNVTMIDLRRLLEDKKRQGRRIIIHADELTPFGKVMEVSNVAQTLGYEIAYATQPPAPSLAH